MKGINAIFGVLATATVGHAGMEDRTLLEDTTCNTYKEKKGQKSFGWDNKYYFCSKVPGSLVSPLTGDSLSNECKKLCDSEPRCASYEVARPAILPLYEQWNTDEIPNCNIHLSNYTSTGDLYVDSAAATAASSSAENNIDNCQREASCWTHYGKTNARDCDEGTTTFAPSSAPSDQDASKEDTNSLSSFDDDWMWTEDDDDNDWILANDDNWILGDDARIGFDDWILGEDARVVDDDRGYCRLLMNRHDVSEEDADWYRERLAYFVHGGCSEHDDFMEWGTYPNETRITSLLKQAHADCSQAIKAGTTVAVPAMADNNSGDATMIWKVLCLILIVAIVGLLGAITFIASMSSRKVSGDAVEPSKVDVPAVV